MCQVFCLNNEKVANICSYSLLGNRHGDQLLSQGRWSHVVGTVPMQYQRKTQISSNICYQLFSKLVMYCFFIIFIGTFLDMRNVDQGDSSAAQHQTGKFKIMSPLLGTTKEIFKKYLNDYIHHR